MDNSVKFVRYVKASQSDHVCYTNSEFSFDSQEKTRQNERLLNQNNDIFIAKVTGEELQTFEWTWRKQINY